MRELISVTDKGKKILENISKTIEHMSEPEKDALLIFSEGMACKAELDKEKRDNRSS